jgi:hypothetical protein
MKRSSRGLEPDTVPRGLEPELCITTKTGSKAPSGSESETTLRGQTIGNSSTCGPCMEPAPSGPEPDHRYVNLQ